MPKKTKKKDLPIAVTLHVPTSGLADSGARSATVTGALREPSSVDAGRYDLIPPEALAAAACAPVPANRNEAELWLANALAVGQLSGIASFIAYLVASELGGWHRIAVHYARGALKYADRNWEKGLETGRTVSSLYRHLDKAKRGLVDEDHWAAAAWNAIAIYDHTRRLQLGRLPRELDTYGVLARRGS